MIGVDIGHDGVWAYYGDVPAPTYDPFKASRRVYVGGRRSGKTAKIAAQIEGTRTAISWLDEYAGFLAAMYHDPYQEVRDLVRKSGTIPEPWTVPPVESARWACTSPTGQVERSPAEAMFCEYTRGIVDALAGRPYNRKLIG